MSEHYLRVFEGKALAEELTKAGHAVSEKTVQRWKNGTTKPKPQDIRAIRDLVGATVPDTRKEPTPDVPEWAQALMTRDEVQAMVAEVQASVTREIEENRRLTRQAILGDGDGDEALVELVKNDLRPLFQVLAAQFREEVRQLLDARLGGADQAS